jgi:hypothetical protein
MAVARVTRVTASSPVGFEDATRTGLDRANKTLRGIIGLKIVEQKAKIENGKISEYRVTLDISFILEGT